MRLSIFAYEHGGAFWQLVSKKIVAGLAGYRENGCFSGKGQKKLCECLKEFLGIAAALGVTDVRAFATASLRYSSNSDEVISEVLTNTGINLQLLSGEEEARLSFLGARHSTNIENGLVVDIGGASCELILVRVGAIEELYSIPLGCLSLSLKTGSSIFLGSHAVKTMQEGIEKQLLAAAHIFSNASEEICFVGGTARAAYRVASEIEPRADDILLSGDISHIIAGLRTKSVEVIEAVRLAAPERIFTLLAGTLIMQSIVKHSKATSLMVSRCGVREGYLIERIIDQRGQ